VGYLLFDSVFVKREMLSREAVDDYAGFLVKHLSVDYDELRAELNRFVSRARLL
jgi:hypothetical protein